MAQEFVNCYDVLGVQPNATRDEIQQAYHRRSRQYHPDLSTSPRARALQKRLNEAFDVLNDPKKRAEFDNQLQARAASMKRGLPSTRIGYSGSNKEPKMRSTTFRTAAFVLGILLAGIILASAANTAFRRPPSAEDQAAAEMEKLAVTQQALAEKQRLLEQEEAVRALEEKAAQRRQDAAIKTAKLKALQQQGDKILVLLRTLEQEVKDWDIEVLSLLESDRGKFLAANDDDVRAFQAIYKSKRADKSDVEAIRERVTLALQPVADELKKPEPLWVPDEALITHLREEEAAIETLIEESKAPRTQVEHLLAIAERVGKTNALTLRQAISELEQRTASAQGKKLADIDREYQLKLQEAELALKKEQREGELRLLQAKTAETKLSTEQALEHEKLVERAKSGQTRSILGYFLMPAYFQADGSHSAERKPMSYSQLEGRGCLQPSARGLEELLHVLVEYTNNDRPLWEEPPAIARLSSSRRDQLNAMQKALIELGPTLVELKMLEP